VDLSSLGRFRVSHFGEGFRVSELGLMGCGCGEQEADLIRLKREAKLKGGFYVEPEAKLMFIIRIRG
jgi:hypothetical protein